MEIKRMKTEYDDSAIDDPELVDAIGQLQEVQDELERVNEEASDKVLEVEERYNAIRRPVYERRSNVIRNIPDFWLTAFQSHPLMVDFLTEDDQKVLKYLHSLDVEEFQDVKAGFSITLSFRPNPHLVDTVLHKEFRYTQEGTVSVKGTKPRWKPGMEPRSGAADGENGSGGKREREEPQSFFKWFEVLEEDTNAFVLDDEIADILKDDLWPNPLRYFTQTDEDESDGLEEEEDEDEEDEEDYEDEDGLAGGQGGGLHDHEDDMLDIPLRDDEDYTDPDGEEEEEEEEEVEDSKEGSKDGGEGKEGEE